MADGDASRPRRRDGGPTLLERLDGRRVCVCLGSGGVGKTTTSAALGLGLAARGLRVAVLTIDPAPRLAAALGLRELSGQPARIEPAALAAAGLAVEGELWAMMLDAKGTFDDIVTRLAPDADAREQILANPIYRELSGAVAGSQELGAVTKLYELRYERDFDVIVLDTPPSRNAVDFLEAPTRLLGFLEGRALKVFIAPGGLAARALGRSAAVAFAIFARVTGIDMLADLSAFFGSLAGVLDGFAARTRAVASLLRDPSTTFVIVTSPEAQPAAEAAFLADQLTTKGMARGALIVNRVHFAGLGGLTLEQASAELAGAVGVGLGARLARNLADFEVLASRDTETVARLSVRLGEAHPVLVPQLDQDVEDLAGLARLTGHLLGPIGVQAPASARA